MRKIILGGILALACQVAVAQTAIEQRLSAAEMHEAGLDTLTPAQLAALNRLLREKPGTPLASAPTLAPIPAAAREAQGRDDAEATRSFIGLDEKPIHSRIDGTVSGWEPGTVFVLANGQQWKVLKGEMRLSKPMQAPEIMVVPGISGRWFLQVDEDLPKARVYRID